MYKNKLIFFKFTDLINESSKYDELGVGGISNKDNSDPKQLKWEMKRDQKFGQNGSKKPKFSKFKKSSNKNKIKKNK